jgi:hypothetical protein
MLYTPQSTYSKNAKSHINIRRLYPDLIKQCTKISKRLEVVLRLRRFDF